MDNEEKQRNYELAEKLLSEQNFTSAVIAGAIATVLAAVAYGIAVAMLPVSDGFASALVGVVIGFTMGFLGRGISAKFSVLAALYTIAGCLLGNLFSKIMGLARVSSTWPIDILQESSLQQLIQWMTSGLSLIHLVFWFVAVFAAAFLAKRPLSREERLAIGMLELTR